jgi:hypothetical protein
LCFLATLSPQILSSQQRNYDVNKPLITPATEPETMSDGSIISDGQNSKASHDTDYLISRGILASVHENNALLGGGLSPIAMTGIVNSRYANDRHCSFTEVAYVERSSYGSSRMGSAPARPLNSEEQEHQDPEEMCFHSILSNGMMLDPHFYNAAVSVFCVPSHVSYVQCCSCRAHKFLLQASFQEVVDSGPPVQPPDFPEASFSNASRVNALVYNPETKEEIIVPNVLFEVLKNGRPPARAYWVGRQLRKAIYGSVCVCSILKVREDSWDGPHGNSVWEMTPELAAVKIIDLESVHKLRCRHIEDPMKEAAAMQFCSRDGAEPNLLECYDLYRDENYIYMFMPYCSKGELYGYVERNGRLEESVARYWFKQLLSVSANTIWLG